MFNTIRFVHAELHTRTHPQVPRALLSIWLVYVLVKRFLLGLFLPLENRRSAFTFRFRRTLRDDCSSTSNTLFFFLLSDSSSLKMSSLLEMRSSSSNRKFFSISLSIHSEILKNLEEKLWVETVQFFCAVVLFTLSGACCCCLIFHTMTTISIKLKVLCSKKPPQMFIVVFLSFFFFFCTTSHRVFRKWREQFHAALITCDIHNFCFYARTMMMMVLKILLVTFLSIQGTYGWTKKCEYRTCDRWFEHWLCGSTLTAFLNFHIYNFLKIHQIRGTGKRRRCLGGVCNAQSVAEEKRVRACTAAMLERSRRGVGSGEEGVRCGDEQSRTRRWWKVQTDVCTFCTYRTIKILRRIQFDGKIASWGYDGGFFYRYSDSGGETWSDEAFQIEIPTKIDRQNQWNGTVQLMWLVDKGFQIGNDAFVAFTKIGLYAVEPPTVDGYFIPRIFKRRRSEQSEMGSHQVTMMEYEVTTTTMWRKVVDWIMSNHLHFKWISCDFIESQQHEWVVCRVRTDGGFWAVQDLWMVVNPTVTSSVDLDTIRCDSLCRTWLGSGAARSSVEKSSWPDHTDCTARLCERRGFCRCSHALLQRRTRSSCFESRSVSGRIEIRTGWFQVPSWKTRKERPLSGVNLKLHCTFLVQVWRKDVVQVILTLLSNVTTRHLRVLICGLRKRKAVCSSSQGSWRLFVRFTLSETIESIATWFGIEFNEFETGYECDHVNIMARSSSSWLGNEFEWSLWTFGSQAFQSQTVNWSTPKVFELRLSTVLQWIELELRQRFLLFCNRFSM